MFQANISICPCSLDSLELDYEKNFEIKIKDVLGGKNNWNNERCNFNFVYKENGCNILTEELLK